MLRRANAELSKEYQRGGAEAEKAVRTGGRVKPQEGVLNVSQAIGGKLKSAGVDQKTITAIIVKMARPYFQKIFKQRGIEDVKIKESMVEDAAKSLITENKNIKIKIKRK
jgi:3-oxoacyl-[acyl-carrier-protein] synthase III